MPFCWLVNDSLMHRIDASDDYNIICFAHADTNNAVLVIIYFDIVF